MGVGEASTPITTNRTARITRTTFQPPLVAPRVRNSFTPAAKHSAPTAIPTAVTESMSKRKTINENSIQSEP